LFPSHSPCTGRLLHGSERPCSRQASLSTKHYISVCNCEVNANPLVNAPNSSCRNVSHCSSTFSGRKNLSLGNEMVGRDRWDCGRPVPRRQRNSCRKHELQESSILGLRSVVTEASAEFSACFIDLTNRLLAHFALFKRMATPPTHSSVNKRLLQRGTKSPVLRRNKNLRLCRVGAFENPH
jgi:hypothetical protein